MLLSVLISFILARRFKGKVYVLLMTVVLILMSLLSIGMHACMHRAHASASLIDV